jgi:hypothetical protein
MFPRALLAVALLAPCVAAADPPKPVPALDLDQAAVDVLKDVHNRGADLYNAADAAGAFRLYEGALRTVGPFLKHRPKVVRAIDDGLADIAKLTTAKEQAFRAHEVIERVRAELKAEITQAENGPGKRTTVSVAAVVGAAAHFVADQKLEPK